MTLSRLARLFAAAVAALACVSLVAQFVVDAAEHPGDSALVVIWKMARYFTILTNAMIAAGFARVALSGRALRPGWAGGLTLWIAITAVVYHLLLARELQGLEFWSDLGLHTFVPICALGWWAVWADRAGLGLRAALFWLIWPLLYVVYALLRGLSDGTYPYFFVNPDTQGWAGVLGWSAGLAFGFSLGGLAVIGIARLLPRRG